MHGPIQITEYGTRRFYSIQHIHRRFKERDMQKLVQQQQRDWRAYNKNKKRGLPAVPTGLCFILDDCAFAGNMGFENQRNFTMAVIPHHLCVCHRMLAIWVKNCADKSTWSLPHAKSSGKLENIARQLLWYFRIAQRFSKNVSSTH